MKMVNTKPLQNGANECLEKKTLAVKIFHQHTIQQISNFNLLIPNSLSRQEHIYINLLTSINQSQNLHWPRE
jgi:hypothetical protein